MAVLDNTSLNASIDEAWDLVVEEGRYAESTIVPRIMNKSDLVKRSGDSVNLTYEPTLTVGAVTGATGAFTPQAYTLNSVAVSCDQWVQCAIEVLDKANFQSFYSPESTFPSRAAKAMAEQFDTHLGSLYSGFTTNTVGTSSEPFVFDDVMCLSAMLKLADKKIPKNELSFILPPIAFYKGIFTKPEFRDADKTGLPKSVLSTNFRESILKVPAYETPLLTTVDQAKVGYLLHKSAMAIAMNKKNDFRRAEGTAAGKFSLIVAMQSLYGVKVFREDHGVALYIRNS